MKRDGIKRKVGRIRTIIRVMQIADIDAPVLTLHFA